MQIIVTTFKSVLLIDSKSGKIRTIHDGAGVYYGITWNKKKLFVAARFGYKDELGQVERIAVFDHKLNHKGYLDGANETNAGYHSIQWDPKFNNLWMTAPHQNKIIILKNFFHTAFIKIYIFVPCKQHGYLPCIN